MKKILENKKLLFFIIIFIIVLIRLFLTSSFLPYIRGGYRFDDIMMLNMSQSLIDGNYLGIYNEMSLVKGLMFPLFVATLNLIKIPYLLGMDLLYIFSILFFSYSIKPIIKKKSSLIIIILFLLFNPISYSKLTFLVFYRNWFNVCIIIIYFASLINFYFKKNLLNGILVGLIFSVAFFTREDYIWLVPSLILVLFYTKTKLINKVLPIISFVFIVLSISFLNYIYYGVFTYNEFSSSGFKNTYSQILQIDADTNLEKIEIAANNSPSFKKVYEEMIKLGFINSYNYRDAQFMWAFREAVASLGYYDSYEESNEYYKKISGELKNSKLGFKKEIIPVVVANPKLEYLYKLPNKSFSALKIIVFYEDLNIEQGYTIDILDNVDIFENIVSQGTLSEENTIESLNGIEKIIVLESVLNIYQKTGFIILILGIFSYIFLIIKKEKIFIQSIILISTITFILGVAYTDISSFATIRYYYLAPAYILLPIFAIYNIFQALEYIKNHFKNVGENNIVNFKLIK